MSSASKHSNTGQVSRLTKDDPSLASAPAVTFFSRAIYEEDPDTGKEYLVRPGGWWTVVCEPAPSVIRRWNGTDQEELPDIPSWLGSGPAVPEEWHPHTGRRLLTCCTCGLKSHPSTTGMRTVFPHLSHIIMSSSGPLREDGWYCSAWCRNLAQDYVRGTTYCADALKVGKTLPTFPVSSPSRPAKPPSSPIQHKLPVGAAPRKKRGGRSKGDGKTEGDSKIKSRVVIHSTRVVDDWADA